MVEPGLCQQVSKESWKKRVYDAVEECFEGRRREEMAKMESMRRYEMVKSWERVDEDSAVYSGEVGLLGALVCEEYLDDVREREATRLKLKCRAGCLPVMTRLIKKLDMPVEWGVCPMCDSGRVETMDHLLMECSAYDSHRDRLLGKIAEAVSAASGGRVKAEEMAQEEIIQIVLGRKVGSRAAEMSIDHASKRFLKRAWRTRRRVTNEMEKVMEVEKNRKRLC